MANDHPMRCCAACVFQGSSKRSPMAQNCFRRRCKLDIRHLLAYRHPSRVYATALLSSSGIWHAFFPSSPSLQDKPTPNKEVEANTNADVNPTTAISPYLGVVMKDSITSNCQAALTSQSWLVTSAPEDQHTFMSNEEDEVGSASSSSITNTNAHPKSRRT